MGLRGVDNENLQDYESEEEDDEDSEEESKGL